MGFFGTLFGTDKKFTIIRSLLKKRLHDSGGGVLAEFSGDIDRLSHFSLLGTPEGTIVTIVEDAIKRMKGGQFATQVIRDIESFRARTGSDEEKLQDMLGGLRAQKITPDQALALYCWYRVSLEHPGKLTAQQSVRAFEEATVSLW